MSVEFCIYLVEESLLTADQFVQLFAAQIQQQSPLGTIAIRENVLTVRQVVEILGDQELRSKPFATLAVELGYLSTVQVERLLQVQREHHLCLRQLLVDLGFLTSGQVAALYESFMNRSVVSHERSRCEPKFARMRAGRTLKNCASAD